MALTEELTFRLSSGTILNTDSSGLPFMDVTKVRGLDSAEYRTTSREWEGNDGAFMDAEFERGRNIILEGDIYDATGHVEEYLDTLKANYAPSSSLVQFFFKAPGRAERFLWVKPLGLKYDWDAPRRTGVISVQIQMFAEDPRIYDAALQSRSVIMGATVYTGFGFSFAFPFGFGGTSSTSDGVIVTNSGNRPTPAIFTINGPVVNPRILNDTTGDEMIFTITLLAGETLVVDTKYKTVRLNGVTNRRGTLQMPTWFLLQTGDNFIRYRAESGGASTLNIDFYPAWR